tara:strand:+ start:176 stop:553 length:378 start_codon:yes stop_codon:yes gene_type:complete
MSSSQELFDIYSWSHITHGILFYHFFSYFKFPIQQIIILSIVSEIIWEYIENTDYIIEKYRSHNFRNYKGDSNINIFGDILFSIIGIYLSYSSKSFSIFIMIFLEIILSKYKANFLYLSIGSLLK